jgi:flavin-dependent dehydrogenase
LREGFSVERLAGDNGRVTGICGSASKGRPVTEQGRIVVGADGMNSLVAGSVRAPQYNKIPRRQMTYFSYWSGVEVEGLEFYPGDYRAIYGWNTNDGLALVGVNWALKRFPKLPAGIEESFFAVVDERAPSLAARRAGRREERWSGGSIPGFFRKPYGSGWALVGDASYKLDPCTAAGITDAFRDTELLAEVIDAGFADRRPLKNALADYERRRDETAIPIYDFACQSALFEPPSPQMRQLLVALKDDQVERNRFFGLLAQTTSVQEFLNPDNLARIIAGASPSVC